MKRPLNTDITAKKNGKDLPAFCSGRVRRGDIIFENYSRLFYRKENIGLVPGEFRILKKKFLVPEYSKCPGDFRPYPYTKDWAIIYREKTGPMGSGKIIFDCARNSLIRPYH